MAKQLGIKVNVDFPSASELKADFNKKWQSVKDDYKAKVKVEADKNSIKSMRSQITHLMEDEKLTLKVKLNTVDATRDLMNFRKKYDSIRSEIERGLNIKLKNGSGESGEAFSGVKASADSATKIIGRTNKQLTEIGNQKFGDLGVTKIVTAMRILADGSRQTKKTLSEVRSEFKKVQETTQNGKLLNAKTVTDQEAAAKRIVGVMKEISELEKKSLSQNPAASDETISRINTLKGELGELKQAYAKVFDKNADEDPIIKKNKALNEYKETLKLIDTMDAESNRRNSEKISSLKEMASVMNEISKLQRNSMGADSGSADVMSQRIEHLTGNLKTLKQAYKDAFNEDADSSDIIKQTEALNRYQEDLKQAAIIKQQSAQYDKETASILKQIVSLENERHSLLTKAQSAGQEEASVLRQQAQAIQEKSAELQKQTSLEERLSSSQKESLNTLKQENAAARDFAQKLSDASASDKARVEAQKATYASLKSEMKEIYNLKKQISALDEFKKAGAITGKEESKLQQLQAELKLRESIYAASKQQASSEKGLSSGQQAALSSLEKQKSLQLESAQATSKAAAQARKTAQEYDEVAASVRRVAQLSEKLPDAGLEEASTIRKIIALEEQKQSAIRETIQLQGRVNNAREEEIANSRQQTAQIQRQNAELRESRSIDRKNNNTGSGMESNIGILGNMLNPRAIASDVRQAAMTIYDSVASVDEQMVNIAKVAEEPQVELDKFSSTLYDTASAVGKTAEEYGVSVERWITSGKSLAESVELANTSVMGSFVGNINEEDMVKYMSVPLNAFKKDSLEAEDIINSMNEVANKNAIEMDDLGAAYQRASATSSQAGTSFSQLTGMITGAQEATRLGGEKIGTAIKAMDVSFGKISSQLTRGDADKFNFFKNIGVDIKDSNGQLRSTYDIMGNLKKVWSGLSKDQKSTAGFYAAGKNFSNVFSSMLDSWSTVEKATQEAQGQVDLIDKKSGSAFEEFGKQQDSIQFKAAQLKNTWAEFLNVVAGGKGGVNSVLEGMNKVLETATKLAKNDEVRELAGSIAKTLAVMTGVTVANKFFSVITKGSLESLKSVKSLASGLKSLLRVQKNSMVVEAAGAAGTAASAAKAAKTAKVAANAKKVNKIKKTGKLVKGLKADSSGAELAAGVAAVRASGKLAEQAGEAGAKAGTEIAKGVTKGAGAFSLLAKAGSKVIPVIGGIVTVLTILDALGIPVFETIGKAFKNTVAPVNQAKKAVDEYSKSQEVLLKKIQKNDILSGEAFETRKMLEDYKKLAEEKKRIAQESGDDTQLRYSGQEFEALKKNFNDRAKKLGIDTRITVNNWDDIEAKFKELEELNVTIKVKNGRELSQDFQKYTETPDVIGLESKWKESKNGGKKLDKQLKEKKEELKYYKSINGANEETIAELEASVSELEGKKNSITPFLDSKEFKKVEKEDQKRLKNFKKIRTELVAAAADGSLQESFGGISTEQEQQEIVATMASELPILEKKAYQLGTINKVVADGGKLSKAQQEDLQKNKIAIAGLSQETSKWKQELIEANGGDEAAGIKQYEELRASIQKAATESAQSQETLEGNLRALGEQAGMDKNQIEDMISLSKKGGMEYIQMLEKFGSTGAAILGVTAKLQAGAAHYGKTWGQVAENIQKGMDTINAQKGDKEKGIESGTERLQRLGLQNEDGSTNYDAIGDVHNIPEKLSTKWKLIVDGMPDVTKIANILDQANKTITSTIREKLVIDGPITLEDLAKIYAIPDEMNKKLHIYNEETGEVNWEELTANVEKFGNIKDENLKKKIFIDLNDDKKFSFDEILAGLQTLNDEELAEVYKTINVDVEGEEKAEKTKNDLNDISSKKFVAKLEIYAKDGKATTEEMKQAAEEFGQLEASAKLDADNQLAYRSFLEANGYLISFDGKTGEATLVAEGEAVFPIVKSAIDQVNEFNGKDAEAKLDANGQAALQSTLAAQGLVVKFDQTTGEATLVAEDGGIVEKIKSATDTINEYNQQEGVATLSVEDKDVLQKKLAADGLIAQFDGKTGMATLSTKSEVIAGVQQATQEVTAFNTQAGVAELSADKRKALEDTMAARGYVVSFNDETGMATLSISDEATAGVIRAEEKVITFDEKTGEVKLVAKDEATPRADQVIEKTGEVDGKKAKVTFMATDEVTEKAEGAKRSVDGVDNSSAFAQMLMGKDEITPGAKEALEAGQALDGRQFTAGVNAVDSASPVVTETLQKFLTFDGSQASGTLTAANWVSSVVQAALGAIALVSYANGTGSLSALDYASAVAGAAIANVQGMSGASGTGQLLGNDSGYRTVAGGVDADLGKSRTGEATFNGDDGPFRGVLASVNTSMTNITPAQCVFNAVKSGPWGAIERILGIGSKSIDIFANIFKKGGDSVAIDGGNEASRSLANGAALGQSFSASIGSQITKGYSTGVTNSSTSSDKPATVSEDVWRYWAKELFNGLPLDNSLDELADAIDKSSDNQEELIKLYHKQIDLLDKQIAYQKDLKNAQQSEISEVIGKLGGYGFSASGNQITNLDRARSLSGDQATEANDLLSRWKSLYESINSIDQKIGDLAMDKYKADKEIDDTKKDKELKDLEKLLKRTEALIKVTENNSSLLSLKEGFLDDKDTSFKLSVKEEGANAAANSVQELVKEYNRLATTTVEYEENAEKVQSQLESLKSSILENADAIITYREEMNDIKIDRLISDSEKFVEIMEGNLDRVSNNIDKLKEGLISGTTLSDLKSGSLSTLAMPRKSALEQQYEERLKLEAELNAALDGYAKNSVDRTETVAQNILTIEENKYKNLIAMAKAYSDGVFLPANMPTMETQPIGLTNAKPTEKNSEYEDWLNKLEKVANAYSVEYTQLVQKYDKAIKNAQSSAEKDLLTHKMIIDQLALQQRMNEAIVKSNDEAIAQAQEQLKNEQLTSSQRQDLIDAIKEYEESSINAQDAIKESIGARYEYEFDLMEKATAKTEKYAENLEYLLNIADLSHMDAGKKKDLYDAIYSAKVNQYAQARKQLADLIKEQQKFEEGSYEWNLLKEKIDDVTESLHDYTINALEANESALGNALDSIQEKLEKGLLDGKTLDEWEDYTDNWMTGLEKEIELEKLRKKMIDLEDKTLDKRLEALDMQEKVSRKDVEYMDKQLAVLELEKKLKNLSKERNVQTLVRGEDGKWAWDYVADATEVDKTKEDLNEAKLELEKFKQEQRENYVSDLGDIIDKAKDGGYKDTNELQKALDVLKAVYGVVLGDIPNLDGSSVNEIVNQYQEYLNKNGIIVNDAIKDPSTEVDANLALWGTTFENSFKNISQELGKIIGEEVRNALGLAVPQVMGQSSQNVYNISSLEFPNVTDVSKLEEVFNSLPTVITQLGYDK